MARIKKGFANFDYLGFSFLALGVGALQIVLDKGQEDDWFGSRFITMLVIISALSLISLILWESKHKDPIVDLRLFKNLNYAASNLMFLIFGAALFSATVLMPQLLQTLMGYSAEEAGLVLSAGGVVVLLIMPIVAQLTQRVQARYIIAFAWLGMAVSMFISAKQTDLLMSFRNAAWVRIMQSMPLPLLFVPITAAAYVGLPAEKKNGAAGMMNFMRNMGQSVGTSAVTTLIARRTQYHQSVLAEFTGSGRFHGAIAGLSGQLRRGGLSLSSAQRQSLDRLYGMVQQQAAALSYIDVYWLLAIACSVMFFVSFFLQKNKPGSGGTIAMH